VLLTLSVVIFVPGNSWTTLYQLYASVWASVASSANGTHLIAAAKFLDDNFTPGLIYLSNDSGNSWSSQSSPESAQWVSVCSSGDGSSLTAAQEFTASGAFGFIFRSTDFGAQWIRQDNVENSQWKSLACSNDGLRVVAASRASVGQERLTQGMCGHLPITTIFGPLI